MTRRTTPLIGFTPFPRDRAATYQTAGCWRGRPLDEILRTAATQWPDRIAIVDDHGTHTYGDLNHCADAAAAGLHSLGINCGDRVLVQLPNGGQFPIALFGLLRAGAIPVMCLPGHRDAELAHFTEVSDAVGIITADTVGDFDHRAMAERLAVRHSGLQHVIIDGDAGPFTPWSQLGRSGGAAPQLSIDPTGPALLLVSGGTTGAPKLIPRTHNDYTYNAAASARLCRLTGDDVYLAVLPAGHNFPLACPGMLGAMTVGASVVFATDPSPEAAFATIARHGVTVAALVPALARLWSQASEWEPHPPTSLRLLQVGGAKVTAEDARHIRTHLTPGLQQVFGMAEGLVCYTRPGDPGDLVDTTQGAPLSEHDELRILDDDGNEVPCGDTGELLVRGPYTFNGYFRADRNNERSFSADGFYRTGDRVRRFANGYLEVTGRIKDVINRAGETVSALDLESHILTHPSVGAVAAIGLPDEYLGEKICAAVVFAGPPVSLQDLNAHLDGRGVATHSRPDVVVPMSYLPTNAIGKVDKRAIAARLSA